MKWTTTSAMVWSTAMMLMLATPTSALSSERETISNVSDTHAILTEMGEQLYSTHSSLLSLLLTGEIASSNQAVEKPSTDPQMTWEELQKDPEVQKLQAEMKVLRSEMRDLREQRMYLIARKLGIATEGKTSQQVYDEVRQQMGGKKHLFHGKHVPKDRILESPHD